MLVSWLFDVLNASCICYTKFNCLPFLLFPVARENSELVLVLRIRIDGVQHVKKQILRTNWQRT